MSKWWEERNLKPEYTACLVSDTNPTPDIYNDNIVIIKVYYEGSQAPFGDIDGNDWKYATPLSLEYFYNPRATRPAYQIPAQPLRVDLDDFVVTHAQGEKI